MELLEAGVDSCVIALWLGHESIDTTQIYLHGHLARKEAALTKLSRRSAASEFVSSRATDLGSAGNCRVGPGNFSPSPS
jgi:site-specific recombinase XerD